MIESNGDLHVLVSSVRVTVSQKHNFVVVSQVVIRDRNSRWSMDGVNQTVHAVRQRAMVYPHMGPTKNRDGVTVRRRPPSIMRRRVSNICISSSLAVVDVDTVDNDVGHVLDGDARAAGNVNIRSTAVYGLERVHDKLFFKIYDHITRENDPERLVLDHCIS